MNECEMKKAFDEIEPETGAQERMFANILKKAAAQEENSTFTEEKREVNVAPQKRRPIPLRRWGGLAACLAIVAAVGLTLPKLIDSTEQNPSLELVGSPIEDVSGVEDFERLGFAIDAPEGAEDISYHILDGEIAQVVFSLGGQKYTYRAARLDGDFSGVYGEPVGSVSLDAEYDAVLDRLSPDTWRAHWVKDSVSYYLANFDGAGEEAVTAAVKALVGKN